MDLSHIRIPKNSNHHHAVFIMNIRWIYHHWGYFSSQIPSAAIHRTTNQIIVQVLQLYTCTSPFLQLVQTKETQDSVYFGDRMSFILFYTIVDVVPCTSLHSISTTRIAVESQSFFSCCLCLCEQNCTVSVTARKKTYKTICTRRPYKTICIQNHMHSTVCLLDGEPQYCSLCPTQ